MHELLKAKYGNGFHIKALVDIYENRYSSEAITISTNILETEYKDEHQKQAWSTISDSLSAKFTSDIQDFAKDVTTDVVANAPTSVLSILDEMQSRLKLALIADGKALKLIVDWVFERIQSVWNYIQSVTGTLYFKDSKEEVNWFLKNMGRWFTDAITLFESLTHKIMRGLLQIVEALLKMLQTIGKQVMEYLYGSMEELFTNERVSNTAKKYVTDTGFHMVVFMSGLVEFIKSPTHYTDRLITTFGTSLMEFIRNIILHLRENQSVLSKKNSWIFKNTGDNVTFSKIFELYLPWLNILIDLVKSCVFSLCATLCLAAPMFEKMFGNFFRKGLEPFEEKKAKKETFPQTHSFDLDKLQSDVKNLVHNPQLREEDRQMLTESLLLIEIAKNNFSKKRAEFVDTYYETSDKYNKDVVKFLSTIYHEERIDLEILNKITQLKTGLDTSELYSFTASVNEHVAASILKAEIGIILEGKKPKRITGQLTPEEEAELASLRKKDVMQMTAEEQARYIILVKKANDEIIYESPFEEHLSEEERVRVIQASGEDVNVLKQQLKNVERDLGEALLEIAEWESDAGVSRGAIQKQNIRNFIELQQKALQRGEIHPTDLEIANSGLGMEMYDRILSNAIMKEYVQKWQRVHNLQDKYNVLLRALNMKKQKLNVKKGIWSVLTFFLAIALVPILYTFLVLPLIQTDTGAIIIPVEQTREAIVQQEGWWGLTSIPVVESITDFVYNMLRTPNVMDVLDVRNLWRYFKEASTGGLLTWMNLPNYVLLLQMVFMAGPIVHGSFLWMYFILTTIGFIFLEWRQPRYHQDGWFLVRAIRTMSKSSFHLFKTILIQLGLMYVTSFTAQSNTFLSYGAVAVGLVGCMSSLNPLSIFSGVKQAGEDIFEITKERYTEAMQTKFNIEDLFVSRSLKNQLLPINFKEETSPIPLLQLSELLAITEIEPKNFIAIERARSKKRSLMSNKEKETVQKLLEGPRIEEVEEEEERPKLKLN